MDFIEKIFEMAEKVDTIKGMLAELPMDEVQTIICMSLEEVCKAQGKNIVECSEQIHTAIVGVNEVFGEY